MRFTLPVDSTCSFDFENKINTGLSSCDFEGELQTTCISSSDFEDEIQMAGISSFDFKMRLTLLVHSTTTRSDYHLT